MTKQYVVDNDILPIYVHTTNENEHEESSENEELSVSMSVDNHLSQNYSRRQLYDK